MTAISRPDDRLERTLYPFLYDDGDGARPAPPQLLEEVRGSVLAKFRDVSALRRRILDEYQEALPAAAAAMAERFALGGKLIAFGNGGSATDAQDAVVDCMDPPASGWRTLPAVSLIEDPSVVSAIANDVGFENVFVRQLVAFADATDIALAISTSGNSANVIAGLAEAGRRGLLTVALSGDEGGAVGAAGVVDHCFVARTEHIPRIQEGHATIWHTLLELTQEALRHE